MAEGFDVEPIKASIPPHSQIYATVSFKPTSMQVRMYASYVYTVHTGTLAHTHARTHARMHTRAHTHIPMHTYTLKKFAFLCSCTVDSLKLQWMDHQWLEVEC